MRFLFDTNLSKIKTKLRTQGAVTGNFGHAKTKAGSPLREIGKTHIETVVITRRGDYVQRMVTIWRTSADAKMRDFAYHELHRLNCFQEVRIGAVGKTSEPFRGPTGAQ